MRSVSWLDDAEFLDAACLTLIVGTPFSRIEQILGVKPVGSADGEGYEISLVNVSDGGRDAVVLIEYNGFEGSKLDFLRPLSKLGTAASALWNVEGLTRFTASRRGRPVAGFDVDEEPDFCPPRLRKLHQSMIDEGNAPIAIAVGLTEAFSDVRFPASLATTQLPRFTMEPRPIETRNTVRELVVGELAGPTLTRLVVQSSPRIRWEFAQWVAVQLLELNGFEGQHLLHELVEQPWPPKSAPLGLSAGRARAQRLFLSGYHERSGAAQLGRTYWALEAAAYLAQDDSMAAALGMYYCASFALDDRSLEQRAIAFLASA